MNRADIKQGVWYAYRESLHAQSYRVQVIDHAHIPAAGHGFNRTPARPGWIIEFGDELPADSSEYRQKYFGKSVRKTAVSRQIIGLWDDVKAADDARQAEAMAARQRRIEWQTEIRDARAQADELLESLDIEPLGRYGTEYLEPRKFLQIIQQVQQRTLELAAEGLIELKKES